MMSFEHKSKPVAPHCVFIGRMLRIFLFWLLFTCFSLAGGMIGYHVFENYAWLDSFLNAAMILGGMGEVDPLRTESGKLFAGFYALYSGLWVVVGAGIILSPVFHRIMHRLHADDKN